MEAPSGGASGADPSPAPEYLSPHCRRPANLSFEGRATLILHPASTGLHSSQCRNTVPGPGWRRPRPLCGADLARSDAPPPQTEDLHRLLELQRRLEHHLATAGAGSPPEHGRYFFNDLVAVSQLTKSVRQ